MKDWEMYLVFFVCFIPLLIIIGFKDYFSQKERKKLYDWIDDLIERRSK